MAIREERIIVEAKSWIGYVTCEYCGERIIRYEVGEELVCPKCGKKAEPSKPAGWGNV